MRASLLTVVWLWMVGCTGSADLGEDRQVVAGDVQAGDVVAGDVQAGTVQAGAVAAGNVVAGDVQAGIVQAGGVAAGAVAAGAVAAGAVQAGSVAAGDVQAGDVLAGDVLAGDVLVDSLNVTGVRDLAPSAAQLELVWVSASNDPGADWNAARASVCAGGVPVEIHTIWNEMWQRPGVLVAIRCP